MGKRAKPINQQLDLLRKRGMRIGDESKIRGFILEIGWYRLSLYWFPFEMRYPDVMSGEHRFVEGTRFEDALMLYAFDFNLRNLLMRMIERVETSFRTYVIYSVSNRYPESPYWFADPDVVSRQQANNFERTIYNPMRKVNEDIILHHKRFPRDRFAPAWKTLEFVTFGAISSLYASLRSEHLRNEISRHFGVNNPDIYDNYLEAIRALRNSCAHGNVLYSFTSPCELRRGPVDLPYGTRNLGATIRVLEYLLRQVSPRAASELKQEVAKLIEKFNDSALIDRVFRNIAGLPVTGRSRNYK